MEPKKHIRYNEDGTEVWGMAEMTEHQKKNNEITSELAHSIKVIGVGVITAIIFLIGATLYIWWRFTTSALYPALIQFLTK